MTQQQPSNHIPEAKKMVPGDELHLTLLMAPCSLHLVTGQDRQHLLAFGRAAFEAGKAAAQQAVQAVVPSDADIDAAIQAFDWDGWIDQGKAKRAFTREALARWAAPAHPAEGVKAQAATLPPLPEPTAFLVCKGSEVTARAWNVDQMRAYAADAIAATHPTQQGMDATRTTPVVLGAKLFSFSSMQDWINGAQRRWKQARVSADRTICLDQKGRVLQKGLEFMRAEKEGVFPVDVYLALVDDTLRYESAQAKQGGAEHG